MLGSPTWENLLFQILKEQSVMKGECCFIYIHTCLKTSLYFLIIQIIHFQWWKTGRQINNRLIYILTDVYLWKHICIFCYNNSCPSKKPSKITKNKEKIKTGFNCNTSANLYYIQIYMHLFQFHLLKSKLML